MADASTVNSPGYWDDLYRRERTEWDMGSPTPVFVNLLAEHRFPPGETLVLGCGKGYDAVCFAEHKFAVTAVDFSSEALRHAGKVARDRGVDLELLQEDLFSLPRQFEQRFDYVVEYVTFCAIDPQRRKAFADVVQRVLKPGGIFLALFFPVDTRPGGPPFAVSMDEVLTLFGNSFELLSSAYPSDSVGPRRGREVMTVWKKNPPARRLG